MSVCRFLIPSARNAILGLPLWVLSTRHNSSTSHSSCAGPQATLCLSGFDTSVSGVTKAVNKTAPRLTEQLGVCAVPFCCTFVLCACTTVSLWRSEGSLQECVPAVHRVAARDSNSGSWAWQQTPSPAEPSGPPSALCFKTGSLAGRWWRMPLIPALGRQRQVDF
jgi:hypothetical protein